MTRTGAEAQFELLVSSVKDYAIFMIDPDGRVTTWNAGAESIKGYRPGEVIGKRIDIFYTPEDLAAGRPQRLLATAVADGRVEDEGWRVRKDGRRFWADVVITALRDARGQLQGFAKVTRDLTKRRAAEEMLRRRDQQLAATLYSIGDGVVCTDEESRVTLMNPVAARLTGWPEEEAVGRPLAEVFRIIDERTRSPTPDPVKRVLEEGAVVGLSNHTVLIARDGVERPIADSGAPIRDVEGVTRGAVLVFRDATAERQAEETLGQFRSLVEAVEDYAIFMLDATGRIATWNAGAQLIKGYQPVEVIGKHIEIFYMAEDRAAGVPQQLLTIATREGRLEAEGWRVRKDGSRFWANVIITALRNPSGGLQGFAKVTRDLTSRKAAADELRMSEERLAATLRSIGDGVLATDERARVTMINPVAARLTGWSESDAMGRPISEVFHIVNEDTRALAANPVTRVLLEGIVVGLANHTALIARDGTERPIADSGAPIRDNSGTIRGAVLVFRDATEDRQAEISLQQSEERLRLMIASIQDYAIFMLDPSGRVTSWNPGAERIIGYRADEIVDADFSRFFTPEDLADHKPARELQLAASEGRVEIEAWRMRKDGSRFWANVVISAVHDPAGKLIGFTKVSCDLTQRRRHEEERVRLAQAHEAIRLRDEFLSIASHELKTPMTALQLQLHGVRKAVALIDEKLATKMDKATRAGERLTDLIEALLDVSRIATGKLVLQLESFDLGDATRDVVDRVRDAALQAGCELSLRAERPVVGAWDRLRIEQILTNLISNAIKYAAGAAIEVSVGGDGDAATVVVRDRGPGLAEADLARIFGRFERASSTSYGGMGLGLYIARQIAEAHRGAVTARNVEGGGASFEVRLPRS